jgi:hypothetical protein
MINNSTDFETTFTKIFGEVDKTTLSSIKNNKLRFELGGESESTFEKIAQALNRSSQIFDYCFRSAIWLRIILWDDNELDFFEKSHINKKQYDSFFKQETIINETSVTVLYLYFKSFPKAIIKSISTLIINHDLAESPSLNITCFYIDFDNAILVNVYDDRGMDIYCPKSALINDLHAKFIDWV